MHKLKDFNFKGKRVLIRVDFNVPMDKEKILDDSRIKKALPTINHVLGHKPSTVILISHFGRPKGKIVPECSLRPVAERLSELLGEPVFMESKPKISEIQELSEKKLLMLENLRFDPAETENKPEFAKKLASFADYFVFDAFGVAHRNHASVTGIPKYIPSCSGLLLEKEIEFLKSKMEEPEHPFVAIIGGAKEDKINVIEELIQKADTLILGGVLANTFYKAQGGSIGNSKFDKASLKYAKQALEKYPDKIVLPVDHILGKEMSDETATQVSKKGEKIENWMILDIGPDTIEHYKSILKPAKTIVWAGPVGVFTLPQFSKGTEGLANFIATLGAVKIIGGGDSGEAIATLGLEDKMSHISTGGGASLELLAGHTLPGIEALEKNEKKFRA